MNISVEDSVRIRYNVWKVIECWLQSHPMERTDKNLLTRMREFARSIIDQTTISRKANTVIYELVKPVLEGSAVPQPSRSSTGSGASVFSVDTVVLNDLTNDDIAKHLTLMEYRLFTAVGVIDCVAALERWTDSKFSAANTFIQRNQQIAAWVQKLVLKAPQPKDRASIIQRFVLVAHRCRQLGNYSSMSAIVLALQSVVISRLQRTMQLINEPTRRQLSDMGRLLDHNYRSYRELLKGYYGPMIPILRILMHDIQLDNGKIPKTMQGTSSRLIHFDKYNKLVKAIRKALVHQKSVYQLNENPAHMRCIDRQVRSMSLGEELDAKLEKMSTDHRKAEQQNFITRKVEREILGLR
ncbi:hypothetical protein FRB99_003792 [Tulasnella sp. 403]|nr:hypothetical protein FRB99_003792 [Tulasnella sp. 403]